MEKKHDRVTPLMKDRIRKEMDLQKLTDQDIADMLNMSRPNYSRMINGRQRLMPDSFEKMLSIFGVRRNYLLGIDDFRSNDDFWNEKSEAEKNTGKAVLSLLKTLGIEVEFTRLMRISIAEIAYLHLVQGFQYNRLFDAYDRFICNPSEQWENFKRVAISYINMTAEEKRHYRYDSKSEYKINQNYYFELNGSLSYEPKFSSARNSFDPRLIDFYGAKITINGELWGYTDNINSFINVIKESAFSLFNSMLNSKDFERIDHIENLSE